MEVPPTLLAPSGGSGQPFSVRQRSLGHLHRRPIATASSQVRAQPVPVAGQDPDTASDRGIVRRPHDHSLLFLHTHDMETSKSRPDCHEWFSSLRPKLSPDVVVWRCYLRHLLIHWQADWADTPFCQSPLTCCLLLPNIQFRRPGCPSRYFSSPRTRKASMAPINWKSLLRSVFRIILFPIFIVQVILFTLLGCIPSVS